MTRASLINLAVYSEKPGSLEKNTQLIARITENHACRAIVIGANRAIEREPGAKPGSTRIVMSPAPAANKSAPSSFPFCSKARARNCCRASFFPISIPICRFISGGRTNFPNEMDPQLWAWVDRLIYDSQSWKNFDAQMRLVETAEQEAKQRIVLCDLNWTRLDKVRYAIAQFFDHPASHHHFAEMESVTVDFAPGFKSTAILLIGWLAAQLKWKTNQQQMNGSCRFLDSNNRKIDIELREKAGSPIGEVVLAFAGSEILRRAREVRRSSGGFAQRRKRNGGAANDASAKQ